MKMRGKPPFHVVVWLMVWLTVRLGFAQTGVLVNLDPAPSGLLPIAAASGHAPPPLPVEGKTGSTAGEPPLVAGPTEFASGPADWLTSTVDANHEDRFIQEKGSEIGPGVTNAFHFVRNQIGYEAYEGSLRGARGTLWSAAGNSLDQASLLIALLRGQGMGARYVRGTLCESDARVIIRAMFDPVAMASAVGYIPERFPRNDPENDPGLVRWISDHWWVELEDGTQLDPCFADSAIGQARGALSATFFEVPDELRHKVVVRLKAEFHNPMSQYTHKTPLEVTFSTPEVYGRALTLGHFINVYQPPAVVTGFKTYTYAPYLMVDDNDADWGDNHLIRGTDYQEFLTGLFALANSTLTRLTLEFEVRDPGKAPDIRTRDILDRVGYAARKGLAQAGPVDTGKPAFTELDLTTFFITPGFVAPDLIPPFQETLAAIGPEMETLGVRVAALTNRAPETLTAEDIASANRYATLNRTAVIWGGSVVAGAFLLDSDYYVRMMRKSHLTLAYYDSPRITLFQAWTDQTEPMPAMRLGLDLRRNHVFTLPYPGQNAFNRFTFNMAKGRVDSILEYLTMEHFLAEDFPEVRRVASPVRVLQEIKAAGVRVELLRGEYDIPTRLEALDISAEAKARIGDALRNGRQVNVPAQMIEVDGRPSIGWWEIDMRTGEVVAVGEDGGNQEVLEFVLIVALIAFGAVFTYIALGYNIRAFFSTSQSVVRTYKSSGVGSQIPLGNVSNSDSVQTTADIGDVEVEYNADGSATFVVNNGQGITVPAAVLQNLNSVIQQTGSDGSVVDFSGTRMEVLSRFAPELSELAGTQTNLNGIQVETYDDPAFVVVQGENQVPSSFRTRVAFVGPPAPRDMSALVSHVGESFIFQVTGVASGNIWGTDIYTADSPLATTAVHAGFVTNGQTATVKVTILPGQSSYQGSSRNGVTSRSFGAYGGSYRFDPIDLATDQATVALSGAVPDGWNLLIARETNAIPAGITNEVSLYVQPQEETALPLPGAALPFTVQVARVDLPGTVITQQISYVMPAIHGLLVEAEPETLYTSPDGSLPLELAVLNTGNVTQDVQLTLTLPAHFIAAGLSAPLRLVPGQSATQTVTIMALGAPVDRDYDGAFTAAYGPTNGLEKRLELLLHVAAPGSLQALNAANGALTLDRPELATLLETIGKDLSRLYGEPTNEVYRSRVLASLAGLVRMLDDPLLAPFAASLENARQAIAAADAAGLTAALEGLGVALTPFQDRLALMADHDVTVALQPNSAQALPETSTTFGLYLRNNGGRTTTYTLELSSLPFGILGGLDRTNITLKPGQATSPTLAGAEKANVILTQSALVLTAFDFSVAVTAVGTPAITRTAHGSFTAREELVCVLAVEASPPFIEPLPAWAPVGIFTGGDPGEGLDLDGPFLYAFNVGTPGAAGAVGDAEFTADDTPGATLVATGQSADWFAADYGASTNDDHLELVMQSCRWTRAPTPLTVALNGAEPGRVYRLQLLFAEGYSAVRAFDVFVEGRQIADDFNPGVAAGGASVFTRGVVITHDFIAEDSTVNVVLDGVGVTNPSYTDHNPFLSGLTLETLPSATTELSVRLLNAINVDRDVLLEYVVKDSAGATVFAAPPQSARLTVVSSLDTFSLGAFDPAGLASGAYTVEATVSEADGQPIPGAVGAGIFWVGTPVSAAMMLTPETLPPGDGRVTVTLDLTSQVGYGAEGLALIGLRDTAGHARSVVLRGSYAYVGGSEDITVLDLSHPRDPRIVHTFGTPKTYGNHVGRSGDYLLVTDNLNLDVYSLTNPALPSLVTHVEGGVTGTFGPRLLVHDDVGLIGTLIFIWSGNQVLGLRGDALVFDLANPAAPVSHGLFFNTPQSFHPEWPGGDYYIGRELAAKDDTFYLPSTTAPVDALNGTGLVRLLAGPTATNLTEFAGCEIPGATVLHGIGLKGGRALVTGSTGHFTVQEGVRPTGDLTLHVLDVSVPHTPVLLGGTNVSGVDTAIQWQAAPVPITNDLYAVQEVVKSGQPVLLLVDAGDPDNLKWIEANVPSSLTDLFYRDGLLYATSADGLSVFDAGGLLGVPVTVRVRVPNDGSAVVVTQSFNVPPEQILSDANHDTLVWTATLSAGVTSQDFTWQMDVAGLQPGEAREVTAGGTVDFTAWGAESSIALPPLSVSAEQVLALEPSAQTARPGEPVAFSIIVKNLSAAPLTYHLALQGLPADWSSLSSPVTVPALDQVSQTLRVRSEAFAATGHYGFMVTARAVGRATSGTVHGALTLAGFPLVTHETHGVVVSLEPIAAAAGQGTPACVRVRVTNTGNVTEQYDLSVQLPAGVAFGGPVSVEVPPGLENSREVEIVLKPELGTLPGLKAFSVTAASATAQATANGTVNVLPLGLGLSISPERGSWDTVFTVQVANPGSALQTYDLSLAGPWAPVAQLSQTNVTVAANATVTVTVSLVGTGFAFPGELPLHVGVTARSDPRVQEFVTATVEVPSGHGVSASFEPAEVGVPIPGHTVALLVLRNTGNTEDAFTARVAGVSGPVTASLVGPTNQLVQQTGPLRLPGLSSGALLLEIEVTGHGTGTVEVVVTSLSDAGVTANASVRLRSGVWLRLTKELIAELTFDVVPGVDHYLEYRDQIVPPADWHELPGGPFNGGWYYFCLPRNCDRFTPDLANPLNKFIDRADRPTRIYRLRIPSHAAAVAPLLRARLAETDALTFDPLPGYDHLVQMSPVLDASAVWTPLPHAPHNGGLAFQTLRSGQRFYRVQIIGSAP